MADDDLQDKTEEATHKKLSDGRKKGQVAKSQDFTSSFLLMVGIFVLFTFASYFYIQLQNLTVAVLNNLMEPIDSPTTATRWFRTGVAYVMKMTAPLLAGIFISAIAINVYQVGFMIAPESINPKWKNMNIFDPKNYKKFFGLQPLMKLLFGLSKLGVIAIVCSIQIIYSMPEMSHLVHAAPWDIFMFIAWEAFIMGVMITVILLVLGILEFIYQKWKFSEDMKMSKQEVKDERRQTEGDAQVKSKLRGMMQQFSRTRMKANVPHADVIIANPTHFAIAIKYNPDEVPAPVCIAKGMRKMAVSIKEIAKEHNVPIVENPPLARALYKVVDVGDLVPPEFYQSVAEVLAYVYKLNDKMDEKVRVTR